MKKKEYYLEYEILENRPGLFGEIASLLGMLSINIITINGVHESRRGLLIKAENTFQIRRLEAILKTMDNIRVLKLRQPKIVDRLAVRHGRYILRSKEDRHTFCFERNELGVLVDFLAELMKRKSNCLIGIRGLPRVGKSEAIVAACVCANKHWVLVSSTLITQTIRQQFIHHEYDEDNVFIMDGAVSTQRASEEHKQLVREVMALKATRIVEHPDLFCAHSAYKLSDFDYIIELRNHPMEAIDYEQFGHSFQTSEFNFE